MSTTAVTALLKLEGKRTLVLSVSPRQPNRVAAPANPQLA